MEKIFNTLQLNINEYIESVLVEKSTCVNPNIDTEQMYNFNVVFKNFYNKYKDYFNDAGYEHRIINENSVCNKNLDLHYVFQVLRNFLKGTNTNCYIGIVDSIIYLNSEYRHPLHQKIIIKTDRNLIIKFYGGIQQFGYDKYCSLAFESIGVNAGELNFTLYIKPLFYGSTQMEFFKLVQGSPRLLSEKEIEDYCYQIKKLLKHTDPKIYLDYLLTCDDDFVKSFLSTATGPVMIEKSNEIAQLKTKLEDKAETVELLTEEVAKWKAHAKELEQNRLSMITFKDKEIFQLKKQMEELEKTHLQELEQVKTTISNTCESKIKKYDGKIRRMLDDNEKAIKEYQDKIIRLTDKVNSELLTNKKLKMELTDINDLYENLQKKFVDQTKT